MSVALAYQLIPGLVRTSCGSPAVPHSLSQSSLVASDSCNCQLERSSSNSEFRFGRPNLTKVKAINVTMPCSLSKALALTSMGTAPARSLHFCYCSKILDEGWLSSAGSLKVTTFRAGLAQSWRPFSSSLFMRSFHAGSPKTGRSEAVLEEETFPPSTNEVLLPEFNHLQLVLDLPMNESVSDSAQLDVGSAQFSASISTYPPALEAVEMADASSGVSETPAECLATSTSAGRSLISPPSFVETSISEAGGADFVAFDESSTAVAKGLTSQGKQGDSKQETKDLLEDMEELIFDTNGLELRSAAIAVGKRHDPHFLAPLGRKRHLPLLLYLPGLDATGLFLDCQLSRLSDSYDIRCMAIPPTALKSYADLAARAAALIRYEGSLQMKSDSAPNDGRPSTLQMPVTVVAESFGAGIGIELAANHPDLVQYLVLVNSGSGIRRQPALMYGSLLVPFTPSIPSLHELSSFAIAPLLSNWRRLSEDNRKLILPPFSLEVLPQEVVSHRLQMMAQWGPSDALLQRITARTLLLASGADRLLPSVEEAYGLATCIKDCTIRILPLSGHVALLEDDVSLFQLLEEASMVTIVSPLFEEEAAATSSPVNCSHPLSLPANGASSSVSTSTDPSFSKASSTEEGPACLTTPSVASLGVQGFTEDSALCGEESVKNRRMGLQGAEGANERFSELVVVQAEVKITTSAEHPNEEEADLEESSSQPLLQAWIRERVRQESRGKTNAKRNSLNGFRAVLQSQRDWRWAQWMFPFSAKRDSQGGEGEEQTYLTSTAMKRGAGSQEQEARSMPALFSAAFAPPSPLKKGNLLEEEEGTAIGDTTSRQSNGVAISLVPEEKDVYEGSEAVFNEAVLANAEEKRVNSRSEEGSHQQTAQREGGDGNAFISFNNRQWLSSSTSSSQPPVAGGEPDMLQPGPSSTMSLSKAVHRDNTGGSVPKVANEVDVSKLAHSSSSALTRVREGNAGQQRVRRGSLGEAGKRAREQPRSERKSVEEVITAQRGMLVDLPQYRVWNWLTRPEYYGLENLPSAGEGPLLFVGNHTLFGIYDMPLMLYEVQKRRGITLRGLADPLHWSTGIGEIFAKYGAVKATPRNCYKLLGDGEAVLLYPGGGREVAKRKGEKYKLLWKENTDFVRMALRCNATIVPFAAIGVEDAFDILLDPEEIMASPLGEILRPALKASGIESMQLPLATGGGLLPRPERLYFYFGKPLKANEVGGKELVADRGRCHELYTEVRQSVNDGIQFLLEKRESDPLRELIPRTMINVFEGWDGL